MRTRYKVMLIALAILLVGSILLGTSYSLWTTTKTQKGANVVNVGCFKVTFIDTGFTNAGDINLAKAYPISEAKGRELQPYKFSIKNECSVAANYAVNLETLNETDMDTNYLRVLFNDAENSVIYETGLTDGTISLTDEAKEAKVLVSGYLADGQEIVYNLRLWIDSSATTSTPNVMGTTYRGKVAVVSEATQTRYSNNAYTESSPSSLNTFITPLMSADETADTNLRYVGANPANYVKFNNESWRIVGIFNGKVKIVKTTPVEGYEFDTAGGNAYSTSSLATTLNGDNYYGLLSDDAKALIVDSTFNNGTISSLEQNSAAIYAEEKATTYTGKVGVISLSDYMLASSDGVCKTTLASAYANCANTNYLYTKTNTWTINPSASAIYAINGNAIEESSTNVVKTTLPTVFLKADTLIVSGSGTYANPYIISAE